MSIKAIIFDADGVVIEPWRFARYLEKEWQLTPDDTRAFFRGPFPRCIIGQANLKTVLPPFLAQWGWPHSLDEFLDTWFTVENAADDQLIEAVQQLRAAGFLCCLATNQEKYRATYMQQEMNFEQHFDHTFFSCYLGCKKPDPTYYDHITQNLALAPNQILFWDDTPANVAAALDYGWYAETYTHFDAFKARLKRYVNIQGLE